MAFTKLPARYHHIAVPFVLSFVMSCLISGIATLRGVGLADGFISLWMHAWMASWPVAFPVVLFVLPTVRRFVGLFVEEPVKIPRQKP